jgi:hypothetical protein
VSQSGSLTVSSLTGTLVLSTLGGYSNVVASPVSSVSVSGSVYRIFREVGNTTFLEKILVQ